MIIVDQKKIIQPLVNGMAVPTEVKDIAMMAKDLIFGRKIMETILQFGGWLEGSPSKIQQEQTMEQLKSRTEISLSGSNVLTIKYYDSDPVRAADITNKYAELLLEASIESNRQDATEAFKFLDGQMRDYHQKLLDAEARLKEFRSQNISAQPGTEAKVSDHVDSLAAELQKMRMELTAANARKLSLESQLTTESRLATSLIRQEQYRASLGKLYAKLEKLQLSYHDTYPAITHIKHQIAELEKRLEQEKKIQSAPAEFEEKGTGLQSLGKRTAYADKGNFINPLYEHLRQELADTDAAIQTLKVRIAETERLLDAELARARRVHVSDATLAELTRDYEIYRDIYQQLVKRRENARVSMDLDLEQQGPQLRIYERATIPARPSGPPLWIFIAGGLAFGVLLPVGLAIAKILYDPRVHHASILVEKLELPVIAVVPHMSTLEERQRESWNIRWLSVILLVYLGIFFYLCWSRYTGIMPAQIQETMRLLIGR
jgi:polysaccharide chain length determinant protein (PEP-CTERM system associated)